MQNVNKQLGNEFIIHMLLLQTGFMCGEPRVYVFSSLLLRSKYMSI
jgi:hypothetical protein